MEHRGLLFIPDISGFTRFINETEIEHSRYIIQELLEILINANTIGLEISEIEGDAILFYKFGDPPTLEELYQQVENMFYAFHRHLINYDRSKYCQCTACKHAIELTLKVVTHYGEFTGYNVKNFSKLIGKDVIVAHQLLKNDIEQHEYWLVTKKLTLETPSATLQWKEETKRTETGDIDFQYALLSQLRRNIPPEPSPQLQLTDYTKMITVTREFPTDLITLFHASGDFNYRHRWQEGIEKVEEIDHLLPRIGMRCRVFKNNGESVLYSSSYHYHPERIEFSETDETDKSITFFTLEKTDAQHSRLTINYYIKKVCLAGCFFSWERRNIWRSCMKGRSVI